MVVQHNMSAMNANRMRGDDEKTELDPQNKS